MEKKKITIAGPIAVAGISLTLVVKLSSNCRLAGNSLFFSGVKQPISLVVTSPSKKRAFDIKGDEIPIGPLLREVPELVGLLGIT